MRHLRADGPKSVVTQNQRKQHVPCISDRNGSGNMWKTGFRTGMCLVVSLSAASQAPLAVAQQIATE